MAAAEPAGTPTGWGGRRGRELPALNRAALERGSELIVSPCPCLGGSPVGGGQAQGPGPQMHTRSSVPSAVGGLPWEAQRLPDLAEAPQPGRDPELRGLGKGKPECAPGDSEAGAGRTKCLVHQELRTGGTCSGRGALGRVLTAPSPRRPPVLTCDRSQITSKVTLSADTS